MGKHTWNPHYATIAILYQVKSCAFMKKTGSSPCSKPRYTKATYNHALSHGVARTQSTVSIKRLVLPWEHPNLESFETMSSLFNQNLISDQCSPVAIPLITLIKPYNIVSCKLLHTLAIDSCASMRMEEAQRQISRPSLVFMMLLPHTSITHCCQTCRGSEVERYAAGCVFLFSVGETNLRLEVDLTEGSLCWKSFGGKADRWEAALHLGDNEKGSGHNNRNRSCSWTRTMEK